MCTSKKDDIATHLELYKLCVDQADKHSERRLKTNNFFILLNSAILSAVIALYTKAEATAIDLPISFVSLLGISICYSWKRLLTNYRGISRGKFRVISLLEEKLPFNCYEFERIVVRSHPDYRALSRTEEIITYTFGIAYFTLFCIFFFPILKKLPCLG